MSDQVNRVIEGFLDSEGFHQTNGASFSDWLKTHDAKFRAEAKVEALRELADAWFTEHETRSKFYGVHFTRDWLRTRADNLEAS